MYRIITLLSILLLPFLSQAQKTPATVKGIVFATLSKRGLSYAIISIVNANDSTMVSFARSDSTGKFRRTSLATCNSLLSAYSVGFVPVWPSIEF